MAVVNVSPAAGLQGKARQGSKVCSSSEKAGPIYNYKQLLPVQEVLSGLSEDEWLANGRNYLDGFLKFEVLGLGSPK